MFKCVKLMLLMLLSIGSINAIVIECNYEFDHFYFCLGTVIDGESNPNVTGVVGDHIGNRTLADVDSVRLVRQGLTMFPGDVVKFFPKMSELDLSQNQITRISNADVRIIPKLRNLVLWQNELTELDGDLLQGMCHIKFLDLDYNKIQHVGPDFQFPENALLFMQHNPCINTHVMGVLEVMRLKAIFRSKCPPVGVAPIELEDMDAIIPEQIRKDEDIRTLLSKMKLLEERLELLEAKFANVVEIRIAA